MFTTSLVELGTHPIVAIYSGDPDNATSSSLTVSESVVPIPTPTVATGAAGSVTPTGATLNATVNPDGYATTALFQYSTSPTFTPTVQTTIATGFAPSPAWRRTRRATSSSPTSAANAIDEVLPDGTIKTIGSGLFLPFGVAVDAAGDVFVADPGRQHRQGSAAQRHHPHRRLRVLRPARRGSRRGRRRLRRRHRQQRRRGGDAQRHYQDHRLRVRQPMRRGGRRGRRRLRRRTGNSAVKEVLPNGTIETIGSGFNGPVGLAVDAAGDVFVADSATTTSRRC